MSQDLIILKNGDEIQSKVVEILPDLIKYKKWDNQDGPIYTSNKVDVFMIKYQNGTKDVFKENLEKENPPNNDNNSKIVEDARIFMDNQIGKESNRFISLMEFQKLNGVEQNMFGQKLYTLEYKLIIKVLRDFWKESSDKFLGGKWYWNNFKVLSSKGDIYAETFSNNYVQFNTGTYIELTGKIDYESTDNGWRMAGKSMFSSGYQNKTSRILLDYIEPGNNQSQKNTDKGLPKFENDIYEGDYIDGKKSGKGKIIYKTGIVYDGEWKNDKKDGYGTITLSDGSLNYQGNFKNGAPDGLGTTYSNGKKVYDGEWKNGKKHGEGVYNYILNDGVLYYKGSFIDDQFSGIGYLTIQTNGAFVEKKGTFLNGELEGAGTEMIRFSSSGSSIFSGEFKNGQKYNGIMDAISEKGIKGIQEFKNGKEGKMKKVKE